MIIKPKLEKNQPGLTNCTIINRLLKYLDHNNCLYFFSILFNFNNSCVNYNGSKIASNARKIILYF